MSGHPTQRSHDLNHHARRLERCFPSPSRQRPTQNTLLYLSSAIKPSRNSLFCLEPSCAIRPLVFCSLQQKSLPNTLLLLQWQPRTQRLLPFESRLSNRHLLHLALIPIVGSGPSKIHTLKLTQNSRCALKVLFLGHFN